MSQARYAIYFSPDPLTPLSDFGIGIFGYDAAAGGQVPQIVPEGLTKIEMQTLTAAPRAYGFHLTLKAPFHLKDGASEDDLRAAAQTFAAGEVPFVIPAPKLALYNGTVALVASAPCPAVDELAARAEETFERFRAPLSHEDRARRDRPGLTPRQKENLDRWGYPYVLEDFHFHMTLTSKIAPEHAERVLASLQAAYDVMVGDVPIVVETLCLFEQPDPRHPFELAQRFFFLGDDTGEDA